MEREALPPIEAVKSSRISTFEDYAKWEKLKKQAYRNQLRQEILQHDLGRESSLREKERDRSEINRIVRNEQQREQASRSSKMKTEQKYMLDNWSILQETSKASPKHNPQDYKEHPFVKLVEEEDRRREETKHNFLLQNKLNHIQSEMRRDHSLRKKLLESQERRKADEHVEEEYLRKKKERQFFENKYLKLDKSSSLNCKKEYLEYLKAQVHMNRFTPRPQRDPAQVQQVSLASPGHIGLAPAAHDRIRQLQTIERSLNMFPQGRQHSSQLQQGRGRRSPYEKAVTERAPVDNNSYMQTLQSRLESQAIPPMQPQFSQRLERPVRSKKEYKQYNIINGSDRIFLS